MTFENHGSLCNCSYCVGEYKLHYGLNIPEDYLKWNAWYVIKFWKNQYFRWTNSFLYKFQRS